MKPSSAFARTRRAALAWVCTCAAILMPTLALAYDTPETRAAMARQGNIIHPSTPEAAAQYLRSELARYAVLAKKAGITLD